MSRKRQPIGMRQGGAFVDWLTRCRNHLTMGPFEGEDVRAQCRKELRKDGCSDEDFFLVWMAAETIERAQFEVELGEREV